MKAILIPFLFTVFSCSGQTNVHYNSYYFPAYSFLTEKTYNFVNQLDTLEKASWKMQATVTNGDTILQTLIFNNDILIEKITERIQHGDASILSYSLYYADKAASCSIIDSAVYKSNQTANETIQWKISFQNFNSSEKIGLTKIRQLGSTRGNKQIFFDRLIVSVPGSINNYEYTMQSIYERGKGLISYRITRPNGQTKDFKLVEIK